MGCAANVGLVIGSDPRDFGTISLRLVQPFTRALASAGVDPVKLLSGLPVEPTLFGDPDGRIPHDVAMRLLERAVDASGDDALGIHAAELLRPGDFDALEYVARSSGTLRGALEAVGRYIRLMHEAVTCTLARKGEFDVWTLTLPPGHPRVAVEYALAAVIFTGRSLSARAPSAHEVRVAFPKPAVTREQERLFQSPIRWGADRTELVFAPSQLDWSLAQVSPTLSATLHRHAEQLLADLAASRKFSTRVREQVVAALQSGEPSADDMAKRVKTSERTLRRRLQEEGTTYTDLLSDVRRELALRYLREPSVSLVEIAFLLGFSNASGFHRAFRRWTGMTPSEHRRRIQT